MFWHKLISLIFLHLYKMILVLACICKYKFRGKYYPNMYQNVHVNYNYVVRKNTIE
jgi:hypothetical protein